MITSIETEEDYNKAMERLEVIFDADLNTKEGEELDALSDLIVAYEEKHFPMD